MDSLAQVGRQSRKSRAFPGGAWEREEIRLRLAPAALLSGWPPAVWQRLRALNVNNQGLILIGTAGAFVEVHGFVTALGLEVEQQNQVAREHDAREYHHIGKSALLALAAHIRQFLLNFLALFI